jgi:HK97 family phage major capsid protein
MITTSLFCESGVSDGSEQDATLYRSYVNEMRSVPEFGGKVPTLARMVSGALVAATTFDDGTRGEILRRLNRAGYETASHRDFGTPAHFSLPGLMGRGETISRFMDEQQISTGGAAVKWDLRDSVLDRARVTTGLWNLVNVWEVPTYEYFSPVVFETSQANPTASGGTYSGTRYGGITSVWGQPPGRMPAPSDGQVSRARFKQDRLLVLSTITRDLAADSASVARWLQYAVLSEMRNAFENAIINGVAASQGSAIGPRAVIGGSSTVSVTRTTTGQIAAADVESLWGSIADGNAENAVFVCGRDTLKALNALSVTTAGSTFPLVQYVKGWTPTSPVSWPTIYGRPVLSSPFSPPLGSTGDLIVMDPTDYVLTHLRPKSTVGALEVSVGVVDDMQHRGFRGFDPNMMEARVSDQSLFSTDELVLAFKIRAGGGFITPNTFTTASGVRVGPAAALQH